MQNLTTIIMAAGKGTRMQSSRPKVLQTLGGKPVLVSDRGKQRAAECRMQHTAGWGMLRGGGICWVFAGCVGSG